MNLPLKFSRHCCLVVALVALLTVKSHAVTITATNLLLSAPGPDLVVVDSTGVPIPVGMGVIGVGYFITLLDPAIADMMGPTLSIANPALLEADFRVFDTTFAVDGGGFAAAGVYSMALSGLIDGSTNTDLIGKSVYTMVGDGGTFGSSFEFLVYKHGGAAASFPSEPSPGFTAMIDDALIPTDTLIVGAYPGVLVDVGFGANASFELVDVTGVPEPSRGLLAMVGLVGLAMRRRR